MGNYFHSVRLNPELCKGCVNCIKRCPTEAIRIRGGKAFIRESRCIDCGECIRICPSHAKSAITDELADLRQYRYNVALPAPSLYAQFNADITTDCILRGLLELGFDDVFEVAHAAEIVSYATQEYLKNNKVKKPAISSACPTVVRLIQVKFPELINHIVPFEAPMEVAARMVRAELTQKLKLKPERIGIWFITPCPAKMTAIRQPIGSEKSSITGAIAINSIYGELLKCVTQAKKEELSCRKASWRGVGWGAAGGETNSLGKKNILVVHEIHNVSELLEQIDLGKLSDVDFIECLACAGGCIGGPLTVENRFVAERRMAERISRMKNEEENQTSDAMGNDTAFSEILNRGGIEAHPVMRLDEDIFKAIHKVELIEKTLEQLPGLDCGSCGSPNCKALAEDIVQGKAVATDCVFKLRERVRDLAQEMVDLAQKLPPALQTQTPVEDKTNKQTDQNDGNK